MAFTSPACLQRALNDESTSWMCDSSRRGKKEVFGESENEKKRTRSVWKERVYRRPKIRQPSYIVASAKCNSFHTDGSPFSVIDTVVARRIVQRLSENERLEAELDCAEGILQTLHDVFGVDELEDPTRVLFICGPGFAGRAALRCAGLLAAAERKRPRVPTTMENLFRQQKVVGAVVFDVDFVTQQAQERHEKLVQLCKSSRVQVMDFFPRTFSLCFDLVVDALEEIDIPSPMLVSKTRHLVTESLATSRVPVLSVDVPAGWDAADGPPQDPAAQVRPQVLVSLGAPKEGTRAFNGAFHFLVGKYLHHKMLEKTSSGSPSEASRRSLQLPDFPKNSSAVLLSTNPREFGWGRDEIEYTVPHLDQDGLEDLPDW